MTSPDTNNAPGAQDANSAAAAVLTANSGDTKPKQTPLPDVGDIIFLAVIYITLFLKPNFVFGDGSTGWHLATGDYVLAHHMPPIKDFFSYTKPDAPWVAYEWLSDTVMALFVRLGGLPLLGVVVCSAISLLFLLIYEKMRKEGCHFATALSLTIVGAFTSAVHWLARPHLFSFFGVYIFSTRLEDRYKGTISGAKFYLPLILFMLIWVNAHPEFLVGLALVGLYFVCSLIAAAIYEGEKRKEYLLKARDFGIVGFVCGLVTFITPYGIGLHKYLFHYLTASNTVIQATDEFKPPDFHLMLSPDCLLILFCAFIVGQAIGKRRITFAKLMVCLVFGALSLLSVRHMPLFAIVVLPAIGELFARVRPVSVELKESKTVALPNAQPANEQLANEEPVITTVEQIPIPVAPWWKSLVEKFKVVGEGFNENEAICQLHIVPVVVFVLLSLVATFGKSTQIVTSGFDPEEKPWMEQQVSKEHPAGTLNYLFEHERNHDLKPSEGIAFDNWGGYLFWEGTQQSPTIEQKVFIDDRADFYGERHYANYAMVSQCEPGYETVLKNAKINWVLFSNDSKITAALKHSPEWEAVSHDKTATLFVRKSRI